jgi:hypothetical protein
MYRAIPPKCILHHSKVNLEYNLLDFEFFKNVMIDGPIKKDIYYDQPQ